MFTARCGSGVGSNTTTVTKQTGLEYHQLASSKLVIRQEGFFNIFPNEQKIKTETEGLSLGWKLHISVNNEQLITAFNVIAPLLQRLGIFFKVIDIYDSEYANIAERFKVGTQITIYLDYNHEPILKIDQVRKLIIDIDSALKEAGVRPGVVPQSDAKMQDSKYFSLRCDKAIVPAFFQRHLKHSTDPFTGKTRPIQCEQYIAAKNVGHVFNPFNLSNPYRELLTAEDQKPFNPAEHFNGLIQRQLEEQRHNKDYFCTSCQIRNYFEEMTEFLLFTLLAYLNQYTDLEKLYAQSLPELFPLIYFNQPLSKIHFIKLEFVHDTNIQESVRWACMMIDLCMNEEHCIFAPDGDFSNMFPTPKDFVHLVESVRNLPAPPKEKDDDKLFPLPTQPLDLEPIKHEFEELVKEHAQQLQKSLAGNEKEVQVSELCVTLRNNDPIVAMAALHALRDALPDYDATTKLRYLEILVANVDTPAAALTLLDHEHYGYRDATGIISLDNFLAAFKTVVAAKSWTYFCLAPLLREIVESLEKQAKINSDNQHQIAKIIEGLKILAESANCLSSQIMLLAYYSPEDSLLITRLAHSMREENLFPICQPDADEARRYIELIRKNPTAKVEISEILENADHASDFTGNAPEKIQLSL